MAEAAAPPAPAASPAPSSSKAGPAGTPPIGPKLTAGLQRLTNAPVVDPTKPPAPEPEKSKRFDPPPSPEKSTQKPPEAKQPEKAAESQNGPPKAKTLRDVLNTTRDELKRVNTEFEAYKKQATQPKADPEKAQLQEKLTAAEKRVAEYEETIRYTDFTKSQEYKDKYETPYVAAFNEGRAVVSKLKITDTEGMERKGMAEDFDRIMSIQDPDAAAQAIEELFGSGPRANMVVQARAKALEILNRATEAEADWKKNGSERTKQQQEQTKTFFKKVVDSCKQIWDKHYAIPFQDEKVKWQYTPEENNAREAKLFEDGKKLASEAFHHLNAYDPSLTDEQRESVISKHAEVYNKATAYDMLVHRLARYKKELADAKKKLKEIEDTAPPPGGGQRGSASQPAAKGWEAARQSLMKRVKPGT
jgi:hypothetical protein